ncbi:MAG: aminotransferase class V-fold PLP-dependent enzyme [Bryobacteraceae bacterium]|nr:aminotransferase class V-fold PLP-dependent enzyme [Bryobacteraceae bacterium]
MKDLADDVVTWASAHYADWMDTYEKTRVAAANLIGASPREIALTKNTSEGIATVQMGLDWLPGDRVVAFREEFPANYYPWQLLEKKGVTVTWLSIEDSLDEVDRAATGARLLAVSFVNYLTGRRVDLAGFGEICRRRGCFFFVDAIQGLGVFPVDVEAMGIDALSADGHKWLMGPEGCAILYVRRSRQDEVAPAEFGWTNVAGYEDYASRDLTLRPDAGRYECGTLNTIGIYGLRAALDFVNEIGVSEIGPRVLKLAARIAEGAQSKGYELIRKGAPESGIVSFRRADLDSRMVVSALKDRGMHAAPRQGWVRVSPHFYQTFDEMDAVVAALP